MNFPKVTLATKSDEEELMEICRELHGENALFEMDDDCTRAMLHKAFNKEGGIIGVMRGEKEIEAVAHLIMSTFWYSKALHLEDLYLFVRKTYRNPPGRAKALIQFAKECSDKTGLTLVIGVLSNKSVEAKVRLYGRELGFPAGAFWTHNSPNWKCEESFIWKRHSRGGKKHKAL